MDTLDENFHGSSGVKVSEMDQQLWGFENVLLKKQLGSMKDHIAFQRKECKNADYHRELG